jgi:hypothetical protein
MAFENLNSKEEELIKAFEEAQLIVDGVWKAASKREKAAS